jgi:putative flippase GtrA
MNRALLSFLVGHSLPRYAFVGVANTIVGLSSIFAIKFVTGASDIVANLAGYIIGFIFSYTFNSRWTFGYRGSMVAGVVKFAAVTILAYLCNLAVVLAAIKLFGIGSYIAQVLGVPAYATIGYLGGRFFAFDTRAAKQI